MTDVHTKEQRSYNMSQIKSKDTKPEVALKKAIVKSGINPSFNNNKITGKPDIVFIRKKIAIFIDGCFWHKCPTCFRLPKTNRKFWRKKINSNVKRDRKINRTLKKQGWKILRIWEHEIKKISEINRKVKLITKSLIERTSKGKE